MHPIAGFKSLSLNEDTDSIHNQYDTESPVPKAEKVFRCFQQGHHLEGFSVTEEETEQPLIQIDIEEEIEPVCEKSEEDQSLEAALYLVKSPATFLEKAFASTQAALDPKASRIVKEALAPKRIATGGANGTYFIQELKKEGDTPARVEILGVFKPIDESAGAINCPKVGEKLRSKKGIEPEEQAMLECVAYRLGRNIVPPTAMITLSSPCFHSNDKNVKEEDIKTKTGSLQTYCPNTKPLQSLVPASRQKMIKEVPLKEFQDLAILDIRAHNSDRHLGNLLTDGKKIIPIDHGCISPNGFQDRAELCWMLWPQALLPFTTSAEKEIAQIDWKKELAGIKQDFPDFPEKSADTLEFSHLLLQKGAENGLSPFLIGCFITGSKYREAPMKTLYEKTIYLANGREKLSARLDVLIDHLIKEHDTLWVATFRDVVKKTAKKIPVEATDIFAEKIGKSLIDFINAKF